MVGALTMIISLGTIVSSLMSVRVVDRFGTGKVTVVSVALTALALVGFSLAREFWQLCLIAFPTVWGPARWTRPSTPTSPSTTSRST